MPNGNFADLDFYGKLDYVLSVVWSAIRGLDSIVNEYDARDYIKEIATMVEENFIIFNDDKDLNDDKRFKANYAYYKNEVKGILEICPLIRSAKADYHYLLVMLKSVEVIMQEISPDNVRLNRFLESLLVNKDDIADTINISVDQFSNVIESMLEKSNSINQVLETNKYKKR